MNRFVQITLITGCIALFLAACQKKDSAQTPKKETTAAEKQSEEQWEPEKITPPQEAGETGHEGHDHHGHDHNDHDGHNH